MKRSLVGLVLLALLVPTLPVPAASAKLTRVVYYPQSEAELSEAAANGVTVLESYGAFVLAEATRDGADWLSRTGALRHGLDYTTGRGGFLGDPLAGPLVPPEWASPQTSLRLVQFVGPVKAAWLLQVTEAGASVATPLPPYALVVHAPPDVAALLPTLAGVRVVVPYDAGLRLHEALLASDAGGAVIVASRPGVAAADLASAMAMAGCGEGWAWNDSAGSRGRCVGTAAAFRALAFDDRVTWVEPLLDAPETLLASARGVVQGGTPTDARMYANGITGRGQLVALTDTGVHTGRAADPSRADATHETMRGGTLAFDGRFLPAHRKIAGYVVHRENDRLLGDEDDAHPGSSGGHGTAMASILVGDADGSAQGTAEGNDGVAPGARVVVNDIAWSAPPDAPGLMTVHDYEALLRRAHEHGARVHSSSVTMGLTTRPYYDERARSLDAYAYAHPGMVLVQAIGNRPTVDIAQEAVAKNVVAVGAVPTASPNDLWVESSPPRGSGRGPTMDGRVKPDLLAPGAPVVSASRLAPDAYAGESSTSRAAAVAAGGFVLLRQYFADGYHPTGTPQAVNVQSPSSALLRAVALAGAAPISGAEAHDATPTWPNGRQGWGRMEVGSAVFFEGDAARTVALAPPELLPGQLWTRTVQVKSADTPLTVALAWTDCPGAPMGIVTMRVNRPPPALCSDLTLLVRDPAGSLYVGNNLAAGTPPSSTLARELDLRNVVEEVRIPSPAPGEWTVQVVLETTLALTGKQSFALALRGDVDDASLNRAPHAATRPEGPTSAWKGESKTYVVSTPGDRDPGKPVRIGIAWGDGRPDFLSDWLLPTENLISIAVTHQWASTGTFNVRAWTEDERGAKSPRTEPLTVTVTCPPSGCGGGSGGTPLLRDSAIIINGMHQLK